MQVHYDEEDLLPFLTKFPATEKNLLAQTLRQFKAFMQTATPANLRYKATECFLKGAMRPIYYKAFFYPHIALFLHFTCDIEHQQITIEKITYHLK